MKKILLKLFITGHTARSEKAIANLKILSKDFQEDFEIKVIDVLEHPQLAEDEKILATPTVVKKIPVPMRRIIGDLSDWDKVLIGLDLVTIVNRKEKKDE